MTYFAFHTDHPESLFRNDRLIQCIHCLSLLRHCPNEWKEI